MATKFPIRYTEAAPSGRGAGATISVDASTGAEYIARGMEQLGQAFVKVAASKRSVDYSTKKRLIEEKSFAAVNIHKTTGDPKARKVLEEQWSKDIDAITSDDPILNKELTIYKNEVLPNWGQTFANQNLAFEAQQNKDAFESNLQHLKETGEIGEAAKQIQNYQKTTNQISPAEAEKQIKELPNESVIARANLMIYGNQPQVGYEALDNLKKTGKDLSVEQLKRIDSSMVYARHQYNEKAEAERKIVDDIFIKPQDEFLASVSDVLDLINNSTVLPVKDKEEQRKKINDRVDAIKSGKIDPVDEFDPEAYTRLSLKARQPGGISESEIRTAVGKGKVGGITGEQADTLLSIRTKYDGADDLAKEFHRQYSSALTSFRTKKAFSANARKNSKYAAKAQSLLDIFTKQNPEATIEDYDDFFNKLMDASPVEGSWWWQAFTREKQQIWGYMPLNIEKLTKELEAGEVGGQEGKQWQPNANDLRVDGTQKGTGFLGVLPLDYIKDGKTYTGVATEYSFGVKINGKQMDIPSLVPTLNPEQINRMTTDIIPYKKPVPDDIQKLAIAHAQKRITEGKSPFVQQIKVISPDGREGTVPENELAQALKEGYRKVK